MKNKRMHSYQDERIVRELKDCIEDMTITRKKMAIRKLLRVLVKVHESTKIESDLSGQAKETLNFIEGRAE